MRQVYDNSFFRTKLVLRHLSAVPHLSVMLARLSSQSSAYQAKRAFPQIFLGITSFMMYATQTCRADFLSHFDEKKLREAIDEEF